MNSFQRFGTASGQRLLDQLTHRVEGESNAHELCESLESDSREPQLSLGSQVI